MKKLYLCILFVLIFIMQTQLVFASSYSDVTGKSFEEAVEYLASQGIVNGYPDGTYRPDNPVTRAELAVLAISAYDLEDIPGSVSNFIDTKGHWAERYIRISNAQGLVSGYKDNTFKPNNSITYYELMTILVNALGENANLDPKLTWPYNYQTIAQSLGLDSGMYIASWNSIANRGDVAIAIYNTLQSVSKDVKINNGKAKTFRVGVEGEKLYSTEFYKNTGDTVRIELILDHETLERDTKIQLTTLMTAGTVTFKKIEKNVLLRKDETSSTVIFDFPLTDIEDYYDNDYTLTISYNKVEIAKSTIHITTDYSYEKQIVERVKVSGLKFFQANDWVPKSERYYSQEIVPKPSASHVWFELDAEFPPATKYMKLIVGFEYLKNGRTFGEHSYDFYLQAGETKPDIIGAIYTKVYNQWSAGTYTVRVYLFDQFMAEDKFTVVSQ
jgi:hypothetical protein